MISVVVTALLLRPELEPSAIAKGFAVHGLLLQDVIGSESPNGAFWSIAVEWQIYFVFPLILLLGRWTSLATAVIATAAVVLAAHAIAGLGAPLDKINHVTPQFLALFALGVWPCSSAAQRAASLRKPLAAVAAACFGAFVLIAATPGLGMGRRALLLDGHPVRRRRRRVAGAHARRRRSARAACSPRRRHSGSGCSRTAST